MDLEYSQEHERFRESVRTFLKGWPLQGAEAELPLEERESIFRKRGIAAGFVYRKVPKKYGGSEQPQDSIKDRIILEEFHQVGAPRDLSSQGAGMLVPTLLEFGTEEQKERYIPPTLFGEESWCQGYSEPGSGSDLASLQCHARLDGDEWRPAGTDDVWSLPDRAARQEARRDLVSPRADGHARRRGSAAARDG
ncbi:MAG: acyl-CoA dehydrogenase family protein, partial [Deltaproteobacteria bacterium]|nr:acyl-CoA dehydrogenase family protein [Deltaproteobacteria bacterium]